MHKRETWLHHGGDDYVQELAALKCPVYMREAHPDIPTSVKFPVEEIRKQLTEDSAENFFTSSLSFMMSLAIVSSNAGDSIGLYGCDVITGSEYEYQRPALEYLIGVARGRGISVVIPPQSALCKANFYYGDSTDSPFPKATGASEELLRARIIKYEADRAAAEQRLNKEIATMNTLDGAISEGKQLLEIVMHYNRGGFVA